MSKNIGDGIINADTLSLYARLESLGIPSPLMVRAVTEPVSLLRLRKCSDLHYAIASNREVLAYGFIQDGNVQATYRSGTYGEITLYSDKGRMLTDKEVWYLTENYSSFRNMVEED